MPKVTFKDLQGKKGFQSKTIDYFKWRFLYQGACGFMQQKIKEATVRIQHFQIEAIFSTLMLRYKEKRVCLIIGLAF